jgi:Uma2 family endonuclease
MSMVVEEKMAADEFLAWAKIQGGRWELHDGAVVSMSPERDCHARTKSEAILTLRAAIARAGAPCKTPSERLPVRISDSTVFEPDELIYCDTRSWQGVCKDLRPVVVLDVLGSRLVDYFSLPSVAHYLNLDPERRVLIHHKRGQGDMIETRILSDGLLRLDPPGLEAPVAEMFAPE